jgi:hypothetical protein
MRTLRTWLGLLALVPAASSLGAQEARAGELGWQFELVPYFWAANLDGTVGIGSLPEAEVDAGFGDLLENLDFAAATFLLARRGDWLVVSELNYTALAIEDDVAGSSVEVDSELYWVLLGAGRNLSSDPAKSLDVWAGARWVGVDNEASSSGGVLGSRTKNERWLDPVVGLHTGMRFAESLAFEFSADVGGFGVGSDLTYELLPNLSYSFGETCSLKLGYRWMDTDYEDGDFVYDVVQSGWIIGLGLAF